MLKSLPLGLKPFGPSAICPKCGWREISAVYRSLLGYEWMQRSCVCCRFTWTEETLDAAPSDGGGAWRSINTAPRDGTLVLLGARFDTDKPIAVAGWYESGLADQQWYDIYHDPINPTHWQPLTLPHGPARDGREL